MSPRNRPQIPSVSALEHLVGHRLPGGCDDCSAYQTVVQREPGFYVLTVHHDNGCPFLAGVTR